MSAGHGTNAPADADWTDYASLLSSQDTMSCRRDDTCVVTNVAIWGADL